MVKGFAIRYNISIYVELYGEYSCFGYDTSAKTHYVAILSRSMCQISL